MQTMSGKVVMVTGATSGIGKATAQALAEKGATVVIVGRNPEKSSAVAKEISKRSNNPAVEALIADMSELAEVRRISAQFKEKYGRLDVLINNAGAMYQERQVTSEGFELTFALNHLGSFLLTASLLDTLKASAPARIINVASISHKDAELDFDDLQSEKNYSAHQAYSRSKLANIMFTYELARRLARSGVTANVLHPGLLRTGFRDNLNRSSMQRIAEAIFMQVAAVSPEYGARTSVYLASSAKVEGLTGKYWYKEKPMQSSPASYNESTWTRLWDVSERMVAGTRSI